VNSNQILVVVVVLLSVGGLAIAAATVSTPSSSTPGSGPGESLGDSGENASAQEEAPSSGTDDSGESRLFVLLGVIVFTVGILTTLTMFVKWLTPRRAVALAIVLVVVSIGSLLLLGGLMDSLPEMGGGQIGLGDQTDTGGDGGAGSAATSESPQNDREVSPVLFGIVGLAMVVLAAAVYRYSGTDIDVTTEETTSETDEQAAMEAVGRAAGRAADRLEADSDLENAIYRAWREMADALDVTHPRTTTPEEFAEVAIDAGMSDEDVRELTRVFEEVRYGDRQPTPERERRAQEALQRIQRTYVGGNDE